MSEIIGVVIDFKADNGRGVAYKIRLPKEDNAEIAKVLTADEDKLLSSRSYQSMMRMHIKEYGSSSSCVRLFLPSETKAGFTDDDADRLICVYCDHRDDLERTRPWRNSFFGLDALVDLMNDEIFPW